VLAQPQQQVQQEQVVLQRVLVLLEQQVLEQEFQQLNLQI
jgi:hypothetical protein